MRVLSAAASHRPKLYASCLRMSSTSMIFFSGLGRASAASTAASATACTDTGGRSTGANTGPTNGRVDKLRTRPMFVKSCRGRLHKGHNHRDTGDESQVAAQRNPKLFTFHCPARGSTDPITHSGTPNEPTCLVP